MPPTRSPTPETAHLVTFSSNLNFGRNVEPSQLQEARPAFAQAIAQTVDGMHADDVTIECVGTRQQCYPDAQSTGARDGSPDDMVVKFEVQTVAEVVSQARGNAAGTLSEKDAQGMQAQIMDGIGANLASAMKASGNAAVAAMAPPTFDAAAAEASVSMEMEVGGVPAPTAAPTPAKGAAKGGGGGSSATPKAKEEDDETDNTLVYGLIGGGVALFVMLAGCWHHWRGKHPPVFADQKLTATARILILAQCSAILL